MLENIDLVELITTYAIPWGINLGAALVIFIVDRMAVAIVMSVVRRAMTSRKVDEILVDLLCSVMRWVLLFVVIAADPRVPAVPAPVIALNELADSSVNFILRPWVKSGDYWNVLWETNEAVKLRFDQQGISFPYPQMDIHMPRTAAND